jgi:hypothetical protein
VLPSVPDIPRNIGGTVELVEPKDDFQNRPVCLAFRRQQGNQGLDLVRLRNLQGRFGFFRGDSRIGCGFREFTETKDDLLLFLFGWPGRKLELGSRALVDSGNRRPDLRNDVGGVAFLHRDLRGQFAGFHVEDVIDVEGLGEDFIQPGCER